MNGKYSFNDLTRAAMLGAALVVSTVGMGYFNGVRAGKILNGWDDEVAEIAGMEVNAENAPNYAEKMAIIEKAAARESALVEAMQSNQDVTSIFTWGRVSDEDVKAEMYKLNHNWVNREKKDVEPWARDVVFPQRKEDMRVYVRGN